MCLDIVTKRHMRPYKLKKPAIGYKVLYKYSNGGYELPFMYDILKVDKWYIDDASGTIQSDEQARINKYGDSVMKTYLKGYHIFLTKEDAKAFLESRNNFRKKVIKRVLYDNVVCVGKQDGANVVVARKMKIVK